MVHRLLLALLLALCAGRPLLILPAAPAAAQVRGPGDQRPDQAIRQAEALAAGGNLLAGMRVLERWFAAGAPRADDWDLARLRLAAARLSGRMADQPRLRSHLDAAEALARRRPLAAEPLAAARILRDVALVWQRAGDLDRADRGFSAALPTLEAEAPAEAAVAANSRGLVRHAALRFAEAAADFARSVALLRYAAGLGPGEPDPQGEAMVEALVNLALLRLEMGDAAGARAFTRRAHDAAGSDARRQGAVALAVAQVMLQADLDTVGADALLDHLATTGYADDPLRGHARLAQAISLFERGRMSEAAEAASAAVEIYRATLGDRHPSFGQALHTLATALTELGQATEADAAFTAAARLWEETLGPESVAFNATRVEHGWLHLRQGNLDAAEAHARAALAAHARMPPPDARPEGLATVLLGLVAEDRAARVADAADAARLVEEAATLFRQGQALIEQARGPQSVDLAFSLLRLGRLLTRAGRHEEAAPPIDRAIALYEQLGATGTVRVAEAMTARAMLRAESGDARGGLRDAQDALMLLRTRVGGVEAEVRTGVVTHRAAVRELFLTQARLLIDLAPEDPQAREAAFAASQEALSSRAAQALRLTAARLAAEDQAPALADRLRALRAAEDALRKADAQVVAGAAQPLQLAGNAGLARLEARQQAAARLLDITAEIAALAPGFAEYLLPGTATLAEVQAILAPDEALLAPVAGEDALLLWVVTRQAARVLRQPIPRSEVEHLVARLREGVDLDAVGGEVAALPAIDLEAAKALHAVLIAPAEAAGLLPGPGGHLLFVPDGALDALPPQMLFDPLRGWLPRRYAVTIAPSVRAVVAADAAAKQPSRAPMAFLGIGNPLAQPAAAPAGMRGEGYALARRLERLAALKETDGEVRRIAGVHPPGSSEMLLGAEATARGFRAARPARFRTIGFSIHGLMAGSLGGLDEPALVLTPEGNGARMDGLLLASDVAAMELDAELVLLSACNTAAGDGLPGSERLSGLARAFLVAGARSLLVSHWPVISAVTVEVVTGFAEAATADPRARRAEALRAVMLRMMDDPKGELAHPLFWAPFVVVGR